MITSTANNRVKTIRKLRDRKERQAAGLFFAEGLRIVAEAVQSGAPIEEVVVSPELLVSEFGRQLLSEILVKTIPVLEVSADVFHSLAAKEGPQGLAAVVHQSWFKLDQIEPAQGFTWVALDSIADPGNLGTILRTHDAVGGEGLILLDQSTDPYDPTSVRGSMGAVFSQKLVKTTYQQFSEWKRRAALPLIGTSDRADTDYQDVRYSFPSVLFMGSERQGLQPDHLGLCDEVVAIPMIGRSDSLNLAVATAVVLYEMFNQRRHLHSEPH